MIRYCYQKKVETFERNLIYNIHSNSITGRKHRTLLNTNKFGFGLKEKFHNIKTVLRLVYIKLYSKYLVTSKSFRCNLRTDFSQKLYPAKLW